MADLFWKTEKFVSYATKQEYNPPITDKKIKEDVRLAVKQIVKRNTSLGMYPIFDESRIDLRELFNLLKKYEAYLD